MSLLAEASMLDDVATGEINATDKIDVEIASRVGSSNAALTEPEVSQTKDSIPAELYGSKIRQAFSYEVLKTRKISNKVKKFYSLQEWEGYVVEIHDGYFSADIADTASGTNSITGNVEIDLQELSMEDRKMLAVGAVFRWSIGYDDTNGPRRRVSQVVFRNLPIWTKSEIESVDSLGIESLDWN